MSSNVLLEIFRLGRLYKTISFNKKTVATNCAGEELGPSTPQCASLPMKNFSSNAQPVLFVGFCSHPLESRKINTNISSNSVQMVCVLSVFWFVRKLRALTPSICLALTGYVAEETKGGTFALPDENLIASQLSWMPARLIGGEENDFLKSSPALAIELT
eukprot:488767-Amphidinium_carterae.1